MIVASRYHLLANRSSRRAAPRPCGWHQASYITGPRRAAHDLESVGQRVQFSGYWGALESFPKRQPFATNLFLGATLTPLADWNVQRVEGGEHDWRRSVFFSIFGCYNALAWWFVYISVFRRLFPNAIRFANLSGAEKLRDKAGQRDLIKQIAADLLIYVPFAYFPVFYSFKAWFEGEMPMVALARYKTHFVEDNAAQLSVWLPGDIIVFAVPAWLRLPTSHMLGFLWSTVLSWMRGAPKT